jgi:hypothetical protein
MNDLFHSFRMNRVTPHLEARSSLRTTESSNRPERIKKALNNKQRHPMMMEHRRGGTYISNQVRMHACHLTSKYCIYFLFVAGKILNVVQQDWEKKKERIIELMNNKESWF